jgi:hypothetical protein
MFGMVVFSKQVRGVWALAVGLAMAVGCGATRSIQDRQEEKARGDAYRSKIEISKAGLAKGENYLGGEVLYVEGSLKNAGDRVVQRVELTFFFKDSLKQVVLKESRKAVDYKGGGGLEGAKSTRFQVAFDHLPKDWNHVLPEIEVSQVTLKE